MIPARYRDYVFIFVMTILMGLSISGIMTFWNGWSGGFLLTWIKAFARTYVIVVPTVLIVMPIAKRLTAILVQPPSTER